MDQDEAPRSGQNLLGIGLLTGFVSALFAAGGGPFFSIVMQWRYGRSIKEINGAALALLACVASVNLGVRHLIEPRDIALAIGVIALVCGLAGSLFGKWLEARCKSQCLTAGFACLLILAGLRMMGVCIFPAFPVSDILVLPIVGVVGFIAGAASPLFGMGGGLVLVPAFALYGGLSANQALATSLFASIPMMLAGSLLYHQEGRVKRGDIGQLIPAGLLGAMVGALTSRYYIPDQVLQVGFGVVLIACAIKTLTRYLYLPRFTSRIKTEVRVLVPETPGNPHANTTA